MDVYEAISLTFTRDYPTNPCVTCVDILIIIIGVLGWVLLILSDANFDADTTPPIPPWAHQRDSLGFLVLIVW